MKPSLPQQFVKLAEKVDKPSECLFGGSILETVESLKKRNQLNTLLKDQKVLGKIGYPVQTSKFRSSWKLQKRTAENGRNYKYSTHRPHQQTSSW